MWERMEHKTKKRARTRIPLGAIAEKTPQLGLLRQDVIAGKLGSAARRKNVAREHL